MKYSLIGFLFFFACAQGNPDIAVADLSDVDESEAALAGGASPLDPIKKYLGNWRCEGQYFDLPPLVSARPIRATLKFRYTLDHTWIEGDFQEKRTAQNPNPLHSIELLSVDVATNTVIRTSVGNDISRLNASSPVGDNLLFTGSTESQGFVIPYIDQVTFSGNRQFTTLGSIDLGDGPVNYATLTCVK